MIKTKAVRAISFSAKTQQPKVIALEVSPAMYGFEYQDDARQLCNTQGMHLSKNSIQTIWESAQKERHLSVLFSISTFHSRWKEITSDDFKHFPWTAGLYALLQITALLSSHIAIMFLNWQTLTVPDL